MIYSKFFKILFTLVVITAPLLINYPSYAQVNNPPSTPWPIFMYRDINMTQPIGAGSWINSGSVTFFIYTQDPDGTNCRKEVEWRETSEAFTNVTMINYGYGSSCGGMFVVGNMNQHGKQYQIQFRACDSLGACSPWTQVGDNVGVRDWGVDIQGPAGGSIFYQTGQVAAGSSIPISVNRGTDNEAGVDTSRGVLKESVRQYLNGSCTGADNFVTKVSGSQTNFNITPASGNCYKYRYESYDLLGNMTTITSSNEFFTAQQQNSSSSTSTNPASSSSSQSSSTFTPTPSSSSSSASSSSTSTISSSTSTSATASSESSQTESTSSASSEVGEVTDDENTKNFIIYETSDRIEKILDKIHISNDEKINDALKNVIRVGWPTIKISIFPLLILLLILINNLYLLQSGLLITSIASIFMKRKIEQIGLVYDEFNFKPIPFVIVRIFDKYKRTLITQKVSDLRGRYSFLIPPGEYLLIAEHSDYKVFETMMEVKALDYSVNFDVGMERRNYNKFNLLKLFFVIKRLVKQYFNYLINSIFIVGLLVAVISVYLNPGLLNYINITMYLIILIFMGIIYSKTPRQWGYVYDSLTQMKLSRAFIRLFNYKDKKLIDTQITDKYGRYGFIVDPGEYLILVNCKGYSFPSKVFPQSHIEKTFYGSLIKVKVNKSQISNFEIPVDRSSEGGFSNLGEMKFASPFS